MANSIGAYGQSTNDIGAYESAAAGGLTVNCQLATLTVTEQAASTNLSRIVEATLGTVGLTAYQGLLLDNKTVSCALATITASALAGDVAASRVVDAATATLTAATNSATVSLTIIRRIEAALAQIGITTYKSDMPFAWMDGIMSEDDWWAYRRKQWSKRARERRRFNKG